MCGIAGFYNPHDHYLKEKEHYESVLQAMAERLRHRGPDDAGRWLSEHGGLSHARLSIIDLAGGHQPMVKSGSGQTFAIVYNGELYNTDELRQELMAAGYSFQTSSDTEVILAGYMEYGPDFVKRLNGIFAFAIMDTALNRLCLFRDRAGVKPLFYTIRGEELIFSSELKGILSYPGVKAQLDRRGLNEVFSVGPARTYGCGVLKDMEELLPGHYLICTPDGIRQQSYWKLVSRPHEDSYERTIEKTSFLVEDSIRRQMVSDVPICTFLSGGVDSSYIAAVLMPDTTFSVGFDYNKFNETNYAAELSDKLGIRNRRKLITADECFDAFPDIQYHMDEPQSNPSSVPLYFLAQLAREEVTVVLSGEGADEIFAGYEWYADTPAMEKFKRLPLGVRRAAAAAAKKLPYFKGKNFLLKCSERPEDYFFGQALVFPEDEASAVLQPAYENGPLAHELAAPFYARVKGQDEVTKKQYLDMNMWLPGDILLKADKMCMAHSLELRVPFLDKKVLEFAETVPVDYRIQGTDTKIVMRHAANKTLPDEWANRPKKGFPVPIRYWLREEKYYNIVKEYFTSDYAAVFFKPDALMKLLDDHFHERANNQRKIWTVFTFLVWYKRFFVDEK